MPPSLCHSLFVGGWDALFLPCLPLSTTLLRGHLELSTYFSLALLPFQSLEAKGQRLIIC